MLLADGLVATIMSEGFGHLWVQATVVVGDRRPMPLSRSGDVPDFGAAFTALLHAAGLTPDKVLVHLKDRRVPISRSALYDWKKGEHLPEDDRPLLEVVKLCLDAARDHGVALGVVPGDRDGWIRLLAEAKQARDTRIGRVRGTGGGRTGAASLGKPIGRWDPVKLGVHRVIGGGPMPTYIERPHDQLLRAVLDPAVAASRLVAVCGPSSSGKSRAAYEAVAARLADWRLDYPLDPGALTTRLEAGIPTRTVLWLGELRQYADADGGPKALGRLADLLQGEGNLVVTTMWHEHWNAYIDAARAGPGAADPAGTAGRLLMALPRLTDPAQVDPARGGVIDVPLEFTNDEIATATVIGDPVLAEAAAAAVGAGQAGHIAQYLAGVPDLLDRYAGLGGDPYGQAVITAAMDATRFGHSSPLPATLVLDAAVGYLTDPQRTVPVARWRDAALIWAAAELNGAVRALRPVPPGYWYRHRRLPSRRLPGSARPRRPPGQAWSALAMGRSHHLHRHSQRPDPPGTRRRRSRPVPPRCSPVGQSNSSGKHGQRPMPRQPSAPRGLE